mmetsp:Transcript_8076/g.24912  ORF Transcript_8076/g.24912 Transcript_8076/m.24912 type:complete len:721 (+) Transcript_8076:47-2209(+)|eukprot:CAMPEP_0197390040 /NCGR_PEP_ID=MMETSP1165-20131217/2128_1 /TAXON_ID=284809 /ORGANISM="Chrysocystis fragilis, Strain CCMP3189" /LENGTH=720 /DNA_ID=CAMNT_0042915499 /DNA_START=30 /DNA_END=2192 /DNA_ORIENTATION=-
MESLDFCPLSLLETDLSSSERAARLRGVRGLRSVAAALGCERTRNELIIAVQDHIGRESDDEVLYELAGVLGNFVHEVGGVKYVMLLFTPLKDLARVEETIVHDRAKVSLTDVFDAASVDCLATNPLPSQASTNLLAPVASIPELVIGLIQQLSGVNTCSDAVDACVQVNSLTNPTTIGLGAKVSAAGLVAPVIRLLSRFNRLQDNLNGILETFRKLAFDDAPSVRRAAASELGSVAAGVAPSSFGTYLADVVWALLADEQDSVRVATLESLGINILGVNSAIAAAWTEGTRELMHSEFSGASFILSRSDDSGGDTADTEDNDEAVLARHKEVCLVNDVLSDPTAAVATAASDDASWRVREALARSFNGYLFHYFLTTSGNHAGVDHLLSIFANLMVDHEVEVRIAALGTVNEVATIATRSFADHASCIQCACLGADQAEHPKVRVAASKALTRLLATLSPLRQRRYLAQNVESGSDNLDAKAQSTIYNVIDDKLCSDEHVDVLLAVLAELRIVMPLLVDEIAHRVAVMVQRTEHENWRVRRAVNRVLPAVAAKRGHDAFECHMLEGYVRSFQDRICQVRTSAVEAIVILRELPRQDSCSSPVFNADWLMEKVGKRLSELYLTMSYYVYRITIVQAFEQLAANSALSEHYMEMIVLFLSDAARDDVPNVRYTAIKALRTTSTLASDRLVKNFIIPVLNELADSEQDLDVRFAVDTALATL